ncbi:hypothetical protein ACQ4LE_010844 [Meloidogyne hapla]
MCEQKAMIEARSGMVTLTDITPVNLRGTTDRIAITPESVKAMLEFFYTGTISEELLKGHVEIVFQLAHMYQIELLKYECERFMSLTISVKNFVQYCAIIDLYGAPILLEACLAFICTNKKTFLDSKEWKEVESKYSQLATQLMKRGFMSDDN